MKILSQTPNGQLVFCKCHQCYHFEFGNLFVHLSKEELDAFRKHVLIMDLKHSPNREKLLLNIGSRKFYLRLHAAEFNELKELLTMKKSGGFLSNLEVIGQNMQLN